MLTQCSLWAQAEFAIYIIYKSTTVKQFLNRHLWHSSLPGCQKSSCCISFSERRHPPAAAADADAADRVFECTVRKSMEDAVRASNSKCVNNYLFISQNKHCFGKITSQYIYVNTACTYIHM